MTIKRRTKRKKKKRNRLLQVTAKIILCFILFSMAWVLLYRFVNPPITWLMIQRSLTTEKPKNIPSRKWLSYEELSTNLKKAAIAGEDAHFMHHGGFDTQAIREAYRKNKNGKSIRGGSTISQQTAKNVFLWPHRSWIRKGFETWFTLLIETFWGKKRILEVYLNVIETGNRLYGVNSAAQYYYHKSAKSLTKREAALLIAVLPNPRKWKPNTPTRFINRKTATIVRYMIYSEIPE